MNINTKQNLPKTQISPDFLLWVISLGGSCFALILFPKWPPLYISLLFIWSGLLLYIIWKILFNRPLNTTHRHPYKDLTLSLTALSLMDAQKQETQSQYIKSLYKSWVWKIAFITFLIDQVLNLGKEPYLQINLFMTGITFFTSTLYACTRQHTSFLFKYTLSLFGLIALYFIITTIYAPFSQIHSFFTLSLENIPTLILGLIIALFFTQRLIQSSHKKLYATLGLIILGILTILNILFTPQNTINLQALWISGWSALGFLFGRCQPSRSKTYHLYQP